MPLNLILLKYAPLSASQVTPPRDKVESTLAMETVAAAAPRLIYLGLIPSVFRSFIIEIVFSEALGRHIRACIFIISSIM